MKAKIEPLKNATSFDLSQGVSVRPTVEYNGRVSNPHQRTAKVDLKAIRSSPEKIIEKLISTLPTDTKEHILSLINVLSSSAKMAIRTADRQKSDYVEIKKKYDMVKSELDTANQAAVVYRMRIKELEGRSLALNDVINSKTQVSLQKQASINMLFETNRLLVDSIEALEVQSDRARYHGGNNKQRSSSSGQHQRGTNILDLRRHSDVTDSGVVISLSGDDVEDEINNDSIVLSKAQITKATNHYDAVWFDPDDTSDDEKEFTSTHLPTISAITTLNHSLVEPSQPISTVTGVEATQLPDVTLPLRPKTSHGTSNTMKVTNKSINKEISSVQRPKTSYGEKSTLFKSQNESLLVLNSPSILSNTKGNRIDKSHDSISFSINNAFEDFDTMDDYMNKSPSKEYSSIKRSLLIEPNYNYLNITDSMRDEKMRHALLKMSRAKYRSAKRVDLLKNEVEKLKFRLHESELKVRFLQIDLMELGVDDNNALSESFTGKNSVWVRDRTYGPMDDLFKVR